MKPIRLSVVAGMLFASQAMAVEFYNASAPRLYVPTDPFSLYYNLPGSRPRILFDDVTVPSSAGALLFQVTKVTVQISREANAPAITVAPFYSRIRPDNVTNGGPDDLHAFADPATPIAFGTPANLSAMGPSSSFTETPLVFGDGVTPLFSVTGSTVAGGAGYHSFALGLSISDPDSRNGWSLAQNPNNLDLLWDYISPSNFAEFTYGVDPSSQLILGTQYLKVEGSISLAGDANNDGKVDATDLLAMANHWLQNATYANGDFNLDGFVDGQDLGILGTNWQLGLANLAEALPSVGISGVNLVPEPASLALPLIGMLALRRRKRD